MQVGRTKSLGSITSPSGGAKFAGIKGEVAGKFNPQPEWSYKQGGPAINQDPFGRLVGDNSIDANKVARPAEDWLTRLIRSIFGAFGA